MGKTVLVVEGEKDVETLRAMGIIALNSKNASKLEQYMFVLKDKDITLAIIADNDQTGQKLSQKLGEICHNHQPPLVDTVQHTFLLLHCLLEHLLVAHDPQ